MLKFDNRPIHFNIKANITLRLVQLNKNWSSNTRIKERKQIVY